MADQVVKYIGPYTIRKISASDFADSGLDTDFELHVDTRERHGGQVRVPADVAEWLVENEDFSLVADEDISRFLPAEEDEPEDELEDPADDEGDATPVDPGWN